MILWFFGGKIYIYIYILYILICSNTIAIVNVFIIFVKYLDWIIAIWVKLAKLIYIYIYIYINWTQGAPHGSVPTVPTSLLVGIIRWWHWRNLINRTDEYKYLLDMYVLFFDVHVSLFLILLKLCLNKFNFSKIML